MRGTEPCSAGSVFIAMKRLIEYLFTESQEAAALEGLAEELGVAWESGELKRDKAPLEKALKKLGLSGGVEECPGGFVMKLGSQGYKAACLALECPNNMHTLAELGWVAALGGDQAQTAEQPECTVKFYELTSPDEGAEKAPDLEKTLKAAREFATEPMDRDEPDSLPKAAVGKPTDGAKAKHAFHDSIKDLNPAAVVEKLLEVAIK